MTTLSHSDLKKGAKIILDGELYEIIESVPLKKAQRRVIIQTKIKNLITGNFFDRNFHQGDTFEEAELSKIEVKFLYSHARAAAKGGKEGLSSLTKGKFFFSEVRNPAKRFELTEAQIGSGVKFLKPDQIIEGIELEEKIINVSMPIKVSLKVVEAPPGVKGDRSQAGNKLVKLETGAKINAPLFIKEGDIIEVNTEKEEYVKRVE